jgi:hypothetical protein
VPSSTCLLHLPMQGPQQSFPSAFGDSEIMFSSFG